MKDDPLERHRRTVDLLRQRGELGHRMDNAPQVREQRRRAEEARRKAANHRHDRGALLPDGSRGCWSCYVRDALEAHYRKHPDLAPDAPRPEH